ncbi:MAG: hypothetical protein A4E20_11575 [Nitrospira sp. SG-bin2]|jgi:hypothetical protein|nr:MAG: hypothetical protein A4E20_11575 [Nitrospira sp. SG-bin2]
MLLVKRISYLANTNSGYRTLILSCASPFDRLTVLSRVEGRDTSDEERSRGSAIAAEVFVDNAG